jgi:WD40 repeat protein
VKYFTFISYSHADARAAASLARFIETFRVPVRLGGMPERPLPKRMAPVFRDRDEFSGAADLGASINAALADSGALVVLCSPSAAASRWVDEEIRTFRRVGDGARIFPVLLDGEPSDAFPPSLTENGIEPLAIDLRPGKDHPKDARLRLSAALLGVDFDALKRREALRVRSARIQAALLVVALTLAAGAGIVRYRAVAGAARADQLARASATRAANDPVGDALALGSYATAPTARAAGAMLARLSGVAGLRSIAAPMLARMDDGDFGDRADFADEGRSLAIVGTDGTLEVLDARTLAFVSRTPLPFRPRFVCGFAHAARVAVAAATQLRIYDISAASGAREMASLPLRDASAIACSAAISSRDGVFIGDTHGDVSFVSSASRPASRIASRPPGGTPILGITLAPNGHWLAATTASGIEIVETRGLRAPAFLATAPDCSIGRCGAASAFGPNAFAWLGRDAAVHVIPLQGASNAARYPQSCLNPAIADLPDDLPDLISSGGTCTYDPLRHAYVYTQTFYPTGARTVYDAQLELFAAPGASRTLATYSVAEIRAPMLGAQRASLWRRGWALHGDTLVLAGNRGFHAYDLRLYRSQFASSDDVSDDIVLRDIGDGTHAMTFDPSTGAARALDISGPSPRTVATMRIKPQFDYRTPVFLEGESIAYDPLGGTIAIATPETLERVAGSQTWTAIARAAGLEDPASWQFAALSSRGTYAVLSSGTSYALLPLRGGLAVRAPATLAISSDERFALGNGADGDLHLYRLPSLELVSGVDISLIGRYDRPAISPNGATIAYEDTENRIHLYDVGSLSPIGPPLPPLPGTASFPQTTLAFTTDGRYLIAAYATPARDRYLAIYSVDPHDWQRSLCLRIGTRAPVASGACAAYASEVVPAR